VSPRPWRLLGIALIALPGLAASAESTWTGAAGDAHWSNAANWAPAPPAPGDTVSLPADARIEHDLESDAPHPIACAGSATLSGATIHAGGSLRVAAGRVAVRAALTLDADLELAVAAGARLELGAVELGGHRLVCSGEGVTRLTAMVAGAGGVECRGPGRVEFAAVSAYDGPTIITGGEAWAMGDVRPGIPGVLGVGRDPVAIDGGCLVVDGVQFTRSIAVGEHGGRIDAAGAPRVITGEISTSTFASGGVVGTYLHRSFRDVPPIDDLRGRPEVGGTRLDARIYFPQSAMGTGDERRAFHISGADDNWDDFTVQWDGVLRVERDGVRLYTCSDDGSRVWLDLDGDGQVSAKEWGSNGWGNGQGATLRQVHGPLKAGTYRMRVQFEDGGGPNAIALLWDDAQHAEGTFAGQYVVPTADLLRESSFSVGGDDYGEDRGKPLTLAGPISGSGSLVKVGASELTLAGASRRVGGTRVEGGTLIASDAAALPAGELRIDARARVRLGADARVDGLSGAGDLDLGGGTLTVAVSGDCAFTGTIHGGRGLVKTGTGTLALTGAVDCPVRAQEGSLRMADGSVSMRATLLVALRSPLTTIVPLPSDLAGARTIEADIDVPSDAPEDLGYGVCVADQHGHWFQRMLGPLRRGGNHVRVDLRGDATLLSEPWRERWDGAAASSNRTGIFLWSASHSGAQVRLDARLARDEAVPVAQQRTRLVDLQLPSGPARTGERLEWLCRPQPFPTNPYEPDEFALDAVFTAPDGSEMRVPGFYMQRMRSRDRGDREELTATGEDGFAVRLRPGQPGLWRARLEARWPGHGVTAYDLPPIEVAGERWDGYVHVDRGDHRFFAIGDAFFWPVGLNIRSVNDPRDHGCLGTKITPDRGSLAYDAYIDRLAAAGGSAIELWLAAWNLGLEWRPDWYGFYGVGRYNQENAWRLDEVLDHAWQRGVRVNLVVNNHGQGSDSTDHEWENSPYNAANGGRLAAAGLLFSDPWALRGQERYRRYLIGRYADHPAVLGWKLWSEVNLTAAGPHVVEWHEHACERWHRLDAYHHPTTTHWAGDYGAVDRRVGALPGLDYVCIDAYHSGRLLAELIGLGPDPNAGLGKLGKPILCTEYGGSPGAGPQEQILAELASGPWAGLVSGNAGAPMTWWYEFVDQHEVWKPYGAIRRFAAGEDLRGADAASIELAAASTSGALWCRAWKRPTRMLGYLVDRNWGMHGGAAPPHEDARIPVGPLAAGTWTVEWWDADDGVAIKRDELASDGTTPMTLSAPPFKRHLAFKLRQGADTAKVDGGGKRSF
jgi:hypothetical protein